MCWGAFCDISNRTGYGREFGAQWGWSSWQVLVLFIVFGAELSRSSGGAYRRGGNEQGKGNSRL